jgi:hypothetical protein
MSNQRTARVGADRYSFAVVDLPSDSLPVSPPHRNSCMCASSIWSENTLG